MLPDGKKLFIRSPGTGAADGRDPTNVLRDTPFTLPGSRFSVRVQAAAPNVEPGAEREREREANPEV